MILQIDTALEILDKVDSFYGSAWNKLIIYTTILIALVGVLIPVIINWWQNRTLKIKEEAIRAELQKEFSILKNDFENSFNIKLEQAIERLTNAADSGVFYLQGTNAFKDKDYKMALISFLQAGGKMIFGNKLVNLSGVNDAIIKSLKKCNKKILVNMEKEFANISVSDYLEEIKEIDTNGIFTRTIVEIRKEYNNALVRIDEN